MRVAASSAVHVPEADSCRLTIQMEGAVSWRILIACRSVREKLSGMPLPVEWSVLGEALIAQRRWPFVASLAILGMSALLNKHRFRYLCTAPGGSLNTERPA